MTVAANREAMGCVWSGAAGGHGDQVRAGAPPGLPGNPAHRHQLFAHPGLILTSFLLTFLVPAGLACVVIMASVALGLTEVLG
jgi:hypothetical protein